MKTEHLFISAKEADILTQKNLKPNTDLTNDLLKIIFIQIRKSCLAGNYTTYVNLTTEKEILIKKDSESKGFFHLETISRQLLNAGYHFKSNDGFDDDFVNEINPRSKNLTIYWDLKTLNCSSSD